MYSLIAITLLATHVAVFFAGVKHADKARAIKDAIKK